MIYISVLVAIIFYSLGAFTKQSLLNKLSATITDFTTIVKELEKQEFEINTIIDLALQYEDVEVMKNALTKIKEILE